MTYPHRILKSLFFIHDLIGQADAQVNGKVHNNGFENQCTREVTMIPRWHKLYENIAPYVVFIETPEGFGTGFLSTYNKDRSIAAFATAAHVIQDASDRKERITVRHHDSEHQISLSEKRRLVLVDQGRDSATILIDNELRGLPTHPPRFVAPGKFKKIGVEVGWVGFPWAFPNLCFFHGRVSSYLADDDLYLIDGVAINGVSGGPAFAGLSGDTPQVIGAVSAYRPNPVKGGHLPGLSCVQDVTAFHSHIATLKSLEEAMEKEGALRRQGQKLHTAPGRHTMDNASLRS